LGAFILALGILTGVAYAADEARPGDLLYFIDRKTEELRLRLTSDPERAVYLMLAFADERVAESEQLASEGDEKNMAIALEAYGQTVSAIAQTVGNLDDHQETLAALVDESLSIQEERLQAIRAQAPEQALPGLDRAIEAARKGHKKTPRGNQPDETHQPETMPGGGRPGSTPDPQDKKPDKPPKHPGKKDDNPKGPPENPRHGGGH
jgi:hypothetical protein